VLLSWPETLSAGLFPGHCWLQGRRAAIGNSHWCAPAIDSATLLRAMETMLDERAGALRKGGQLTLVVSDSIAAITMLPWQEALQRPAELESYARICLEKQGVRVDGSWVLRTAFRQFRGAGIAFALSRDWLTELVELVTARRLQLKAVLPITAAAYVGHHFSRRGVQTLLLLREAIRTSALIYGGEKLLGRDVEPVTAAGQESGVRLLRRIAASHENIARVIDWSTEPPEQACVAKFISLCLPKAEICLVNRGAWS
jgi:hypothetical protein